MAAVGKGDARALSVGQRGYGGDDPVRIDDDGLIVRLRELHECHVRPLPVKCLRTCQYKRQGTARPFHLSFPLCVGSGFRAIGQAGFKPLDDLY